MSSGINPQNITLFCSLLVNIVLIILYCTNRTDIIQLKRNDERSLNLNQRVIDLETAVILLTSMIEFTLYDNKDGAKRCLRALSIHYPEED